MSQQIKPSARKPVIKRKDHWGFHDKKYNW